MTLKLFLYLASIIFLTGCGAHELQPITDSQNQIGIARGYDHGFKLEEDSLWELKIVQRGNEKFSGILALKNTDDSLTLALLDPTGLKLFEENISKTGKVSRIQNLSFFENHQLPDYLGKVIHRIFIKEPDVDSCSGKLYTLCWGEEPNLLEKTAKLGPFTLWNVIYFIENNAGGNVPNIEHHSPWIGTIFYLKPL